MTLSPNTTLNPRVDQLVDRSLLQHMAPRYGEGGFARPPNQGRNAAGSTGNERARLAREVSGRESGSIAHRQETRERLRGSSPVSGTKFYSHQKVGLTECPYLERWVLDFHLFAVRLHHWSASDDARAFHDHPWWFLTLVLRGGYTDVSPSGRDVLRAGSIRYRPAHHQHTVEIARPGTWTLLITGRPTRRWGFWVGGKLIKRDKYFATHGHHPCDPTGAPVRLKPNGSRIASGDA